MVWDLHRELAYPVSSDADFLTTQSFTNARVLGFPPAFSGNGTLKTADIRLVALSFTNGTYTTGSSVAVTILQIVHTESGPIVVPTGLTPTITDTPAALTLPGQGSYILRVTAATPPGSSTHLRILSKLV